MRTVAETFGRTIANDLAMWAIDALCEPPVAMPRPTVRMPASLIRRGRAILEEAGIDWRNLKGTPHSGQDKRRKASA